MWRNVMYRKNVTSAMQKRLNHRAFSKSCIDGCAHWRHLANNFERGGYEWVANGDAACCQIALGKLVVHCL